MTLKNMSSSEAAYWEKKGFNINNTQDPAPKTAGSSLNNMSKQEAEYWANKGRPEHLQNINAMEKDIDNYTQSKVGNYIPDFLKVAYAKSNTSQPQEVKQHTDPYAEALKQLMNGDKTQPMLQNDIAPDMQNPERFLPHPKSYDPRVKTTLNDLAQQYKGSKYQYELDQANFNLMLDQDSPDKQVAIANLQKQLEANPTVDMKNRDLISQGVLGVAGMLPLRFQNIKQGLEFALPSAGAAAGATFLAGQAGPQAALPEEILSVPGAALAVGVPAFKLGALLNMMQLEAGSAWSQYKDEGLDPKAAVAPALVTGAVNAALEYLQFDQLAKTVPGLSNVMSKTVKEVQKGLLKKYGEFVLTETGEEVLQQLVTDAVGEIWKRLRIATGQQSKEEIQLKSMWDITNDLADTAVSTLPTMTMSGLPGFGGQFALDKMSNNNQKASFSNQQSLNEATSKLDDNHIKELYDKIQLANREYNQNDIEQLNQSTDHVVAQNDHEVFMQNRQKELDVRAQKWNKEQERKANETYLDKRDSILQKNAEEYEYKQHLKSLIDKDKAKQPLSLIEEQAKGEQEQETPLNDDKNIDTGDEKQEAKDNTTIEMITSQKPNLEVETDEVPLPGGDSEDPEEQQQDTRKSLKITKEYIGNRGTAYTPDNTPINFEYRVVSIDDLITSNNTDMSINHNYPQELQPRDRSRITSLEQVHKILNNLNPDLLGHSPTVSVGSPIIGKDGVVESGNARSIALKLGYQSNSPSIKKYQIWLKQNLRKFGVEELPNNPVLVRVRTSNSDRVNFTRKANESTIAQMSATEQAKSDAKRLTKEILSKYVDNVDNNINTNANTGFIRSIIKSMPTNERGSMIDKNGHLSKDGRKRIESALVAYAYNNEKLVEGLAEADDDTTRRLSDALKKVSPKMANIRAQVKAGNINDNYLLDSIVEAIRQYKSYKDEKLNSNQIRHSLNQLLIGGKQYSNVTKNFIAIIDELSGSGKKLTQFFNVLANYLNSDALKKSNMSFGVFSDITDAEILEAAWKEYQNETGQRQIAIRKSETIESKSSNGIVQKRETGEQYPQKYEPRARNGISKKTIIPKQFKGATPESEIHRIVPATIARSIPINQTFEYADKALEQQHQESQTSKQAWIDKVKDFTVELKNTTTRTFKDIPHDKFYAEFLKEILRYKSLRALTGDETTRIIDDILSDRSNSGALSLSDEEFNRFKRYVLLKDLQEEANMGHALPGLYTPEVVDYELNRLENSMTDAIKKAYEKRQNYWEDIKNRYIKAMADIGFNVEERFKRKNYLRHIVLEYANANKSKQLSGSGSRVKVKNNRGFLKQRGGSTKLIDESYLVAEYEVMATMLNDLETAKMLKRISDNYNVMDKLKKQATAHNKELFNEYEVKASLDNGSLTDKEMELMKTYKKYGQNMAFSFENLRQLAEAEELEDVKGKYSKAINQLKKGKSTTKDPSGAVMNYISVLVKTPKWEGQKEAATILKAISNRKSIVKTILGDDFKTWENFVPEGYSTWQPVEGRYLFSADTISQKLAEALIDMDLSELGVKDLKARQMTALGQKRREFVLPSNIISTLEQVYDEVYKTSPIDTLIKKPLQWWKSWQLTLNPRRVFKYNLRNISGDFDALVAAGGAKAVKYVGKATKELYNAMRYMNFSKDMLEFRDRGGFQVMLYAQEVADIYDMQVFRRFNTKAKASVMQKVLPIPNTYAEFTRNLTDFREGILRYAAYLYWKDDIKKGNVNYGASIPAIVDGLKSTEDKAFQISKDALGAYDQVSQLGRSIRKYAIPFYSFMEVNFKRYGQIVKNTISDVKACETAGDKFRKSLKLPAVFTKKGLVILGKTAIRLTFVTATLSAWNTLVMPDEDEELPEDVRNRPHVTLGRDKEGNVLYFSRLGALNELMEWFGLDTLPSDIKDIINDRRNIKDEFQHIATAPINKVVNSFNPFIKGAAELLSGKSFYPDISKPSKIRDKALYIAQSLGLQEEYKRIAGLPTKESYFKSLQNTIIYKSDPKANAYYKILNLKSDFEQKVLGEYATQTYSDSPKSEALYYHKLAKKYGDKKSEIKYLKKYIELGGTDRGYRQSMKTMSPIYGLSELEFAMFYYQYLNADERKELNRAVEYYDSLVNNSK